MKIEDYKNIYFIGIGGIGMSAIARYFYAIGKNVAGYDRSSTKLTSLLEKEGIQINFKDDLSQIPCAFKNTKDTLLVFTPAIPASNKQLNFFKTNNFNVYKRAEILGFLSKDKKSIGIAGTHGKTTVSTITAHLLKQSSLDCSAFLGGISRNYESNLLIGDDTEHMVLEADEFDRSFLHLSPHIAVITSMDADHLDVYGSKEELHKCFYQYISKIKAAGSLILKKGLNISTTQDINLYTYSVEEKADFYVLNLELCDGYFKFDLSCPGKIIENLHFSYPGRINVENAVAACAVAYLSGVTDQELRFALNSFKGVFRRFDYHIKNDKLVYIDDYAHHPKELRETINSVREIYPTKKITGIFQPHLFSRTRDFAKEFSASLSLLDEVILLDIYPAREKPIENVNSEMLMDDISSKVEMCDKESLVNCLKQRDLDVLITLGAGDIDKLIDEIKEGLL